MPIKSQLAVIVRGAFADENSNSTNFLYIHVQLDHDHVVDGSLSIPIIENINEIDKATEVSKSHTFHLNSEIVKQIGWNDIVLSLQINTNIPENFPINLAVDPSPIDKSLGIIYAAILLLSLYIVIISEIIDRTFAAMIASTISIAILTFMNERPTMPEILSWIDVETLLLLFGMMILVGILSETGLFDYLAVYAFKVLDFELDSQSFRFVN